MKTALELEVEELRKRLDEVSERVRVDAVAKAWLAGNHDIRSGDYFLIDGGDTPARVHISSDGQWSYDNGRHYTSYGRIPEQSDHNRLYTKAEVAAIVAKCTNAIATDLAGDET